ncbi:hypothetical protein JXD20_00560 [Candidatus Peregrinibacteria bacterium]|nr:hypothetical protein [Candidatus Peregrinibacteria bacterium]
MPPKRHRKVADFDSPFSVGDDDCRQFRLVTAHVDGARIDADPYLANLFWCRVDLDLHLNHPAKGRVATRCGTFSGTCRQQLGTDQRPNVTPHRV